MALRRVSPALAMNRWLRRAAILLLTAAVPRVLTYKAVLHQVDEARQIDRVVGEANIKPIRGTDRGNLEEFPLTWISPNEFEFKVVNGYRYGNGPVAETAGRLSLEPLAR